MIIAGYCWYGELNVCDYVLGLSNMMVINRLAIFFHGLQHAVPYLAKGGYCLHTITHPMYSNFIMEIHVNYFKKSIIPGF